MKLIIEKDYDNLSLKAAKIIAEAIQNKPNLVIGFATGSTPLGTYEELIRMHKEEGLDFSEVVTYNLDEYYGLSPDHPQSYSYFMFKNLFNHINVNRKNIHIPDGKAQDVDTYCVRYEEAIAEAGGIDIQITGIGHNGHIGFNEPAEELMLNTHLTDLTDSTIDANARFFEKREDVPVKAVTMGIGAIMKAKQILLLASGVGKAKIMAELLKKPVITTKVPASILNLHNNAVVILDRAAASNL